MKCFALLLLSALPAFGQLTMQQMQPFFSGAGAVASVPGPNSILGLAHWWVSSDIPITWTVGANGASATNWVDRIQGAIWTNGASSLRPTNSATGVLFNGSQTLTNSVLTWASGSNIYKIWMVGKFVRNNPVSGADNWMTGDDSARGLGLGAINVIDAVSQAPYYKCITNIFVDTLIAGNGTVASQLITTNNVSTAKTLVWVATGTHSFFGLATTVIGNTRGFFYATEIAIFTNDITAPQAVVLHNYATNTYSFAP